MVSDQMSQYGLCYNLGASMLMLCLLPLAFSSLSMALLPANQGDATNLVYPFYSSAALLGGFLCIAIFLYMGIKDLVGYFRYGVFNPSSFYSPSETLRVGSILLCLLGGQLLFIGIYSFLYAQALCYSNQINTVVNTSLQLLVGLLLLVVQYSCFGGKVRKI